MSRLIDADTLIENINEIYKGYMTDESGCTPCDFEKIVDEQPTVENGYNQALEDIEKYILNSCSNVTCREDINADNDFDFYASELLDMLEEMKNF